MNQLFIVFQEGYVEILVACYLNFQNIIIETLSDSISYIVAIVFLVTSLTIMPAAVIFVMLKDEATLKQKSTHKKFGAAYEDLKTRSIFALFYNLLYFLRRIILVFIIFNQFFISYVSLQVMACIYVNNFCCVYLVWHRPYITRQRNFNEIMNEVTIVISTEAMLFYTDICEPE